MEIFYSNFWWMIPNLALASLGFVFGLLYLRTKPIFLKVPFFVLWFLFFPNTIYLLTDFEHLLTQFPKVGFNEGILLIIQYSVLMILGVLTYFAGLLPVEKFFKGRKKSDRNNLKVLMVLLNFAIAFAVVLGKVERTHSWYIFTQPVRVMTDVLDILRDPILLIACLFFGILFNLFYFLYRSRFKLSL